MQVYLFAVNLFSLTAFLLGVSNFSRENRWRLLPLFFLVISQSTSLIMMIASSGDGQPTAPAMRSVAALNVFSAFCFIWVLVKPANLSELWRRVAWVGAGAAFLLALLPLIPEWPVPYEIHILLITMFGTLIVLSSLEDVTWLHLAAPLTLALANFVNLLEFTSLAWLMVLAAYACLIALLHWDELQKYQSDQQISDAIAHEAITLNEKRQRLLEVGEILSNVPSLEESMLHITRSLAHITSSDQAAVVFIDPIHASHAHVAYVYNPEQPIYLDNVRFELSDCPPLQIAFIRKRQQFIRPQQTNNNLTSLYKLWHEQRVGPTLIQPLTMQTQIIGALVLGNPVTQAPVRQEDMVLCRSLAAQLAIMVEAYRRYHRLKLHPSQDEELEATHAAVTAHASGFVSKSVPTAQMAIEGAAGLNAAARSSPRPQAPVIEAQPSETISENYLTLLDSLHEGVVVSEVNGQVTLVNRAAERILGKSRDELMGQPIGTIYGAIESGEAIENLAANFSRRSEPLPTFYENDDRAIRGFLVPWRNEDREWLGIVAVFRDVTHAFKADEARNNFISALSRVLRGPLAIIKGYAELSMNGSLEDYSPDQLRVQQIIHSSVDRVIEVLDNSLQISKQPRHKISPKFEEINVKAIIAQVLSEIEPLAHLRNIGLFQEIPVELPRITADETHVYKMLENLLSNACRFTPPGGQVTVRAWVQDEREGNRFTPYLMLAVADSGVGIPQRDLKKIFEPFYQLENQDPIEEKGMGMGLTVVKELVEAHHGRVWAESELGHGSVFYVMLPVTQD